MLLELASVAWVAAVILAALLLPLVLSGEKE